MKVKPKNEILLAEAFNSIQGEFPDVGTPYTFVRFKACNLHCPFCVKLEDDKNFIVFREDENEWFETNDLQLILQNQFPILAAHRQITYIEGASRFEFDHYYKITVRSLDGIEEHTFFVSFDHLFATVFKEQYRCTQVNFPQDSITNPSVLSRYQWTPASLLDPEKLYIVGIRGMYEIVDKQLIQDRITLEGLVTTTGTFVYGGVIHHNCDSALVMKEGKVRLKLDEIVSLVKETGSILFTGGEPGLYHAQIGSILDTLKNALRTKELSSIYALAMETNGYKLNESRQILLRFSDEISSVQGFKPAIRIAWSPKMYDDESLQFSLQVLKNLNFEIGPSDVVFVKPVYDEKNLERLQVFLDNLFDKFGERAKWCVGLMPEGATRDTLLDRNYIQRLLAFAKKYKIGISPRLHIIYGLS